MASRVPILGAGDKVQQRHLPVADETTPGVVELATASETATGTAPDRAVHPAGLKGVTDTLARRTAAWKANTAYVTGELVTNGGVLYQRGTAGTSGATFSATNWTAITSGSTAATPPTGVSIVWQFPFTDPAVARPTVPSNVTLNWVGPAGTGGSAPTNMAVGDTWDMRVS